MILLDLSSTAHLVSCEACLMAATTGAPSFGATTAAGGRPPLRRNWSAAQ